MDIHFDVNVQAEYLREWDMDGCQAVMLRIKGAGNSETKIFSYLGLPDGEEEVPGILLIHGGGGTAYTQWVNRWVRRGYAALAIDIEGSAGCYRCDKYRGTGLTRTGDFDDTDRPAEEHWMYRVIQGAIAAEHFLSGHLRVKQEQIGVMGISWGGLAAANLITYSREFAFCIAVYGCGCREDEPAYFGKVFRENKIAAELWEPSRRLAGNRTPTLWLNSDNDAFFSIRSMSYCHEKMRYSSMSVIPGFAHGHDPAWEEEISYFFADSVVGKEKPFPQIKITCSNDKQEIYVKTERLDPCMKYRIQLRFSSDPFLHDTDGRGCTVWKAGEKIIVTQKEFTLPLPPDAKIFYVNLTDDRGMIYSSNVVEI